LILTGLGTVSDTGDGKHGRETAPRILLIFLRLGLTSFGGPTAHVGYYHQEFVSRRRWLGETDFANLLAMSQFLPGATSTQVAVAIGMLRGGVAGGVAAFVGFVLPSAALMIAFAYGLAALGGVDIAGWLTGLKVAAVAVVARAVLTMARNLCPDRARATLAVAAAIGVLAWPGPLGQLGAILIGGLIGWRMLGNDGDDKPAKTVLPGGRGVALVSLALFVALLLGLPVLAQFVPSQTLAQIDAFYRSGALVFGGGHVMLPLLEAEVVPPGWIAHETFIAGYGAAQALPGPLFTFASFLGVAMAPAPGEALSGGVAGGLICLAAIFLPSVLLVFAVLPFWSRLAAYRTMRAAMRGINAAVVGLLLAALYDPVWTNAIDGPATFALAAAAFAALHLWKAPPWAVVIACAAGGAGLAAL
jgi:chromate transporter